jgi:hypothetical protein
MPEFKKIVLVWEDRIAIGDNIEAALLTLKGETKTPSLPVEDTAQDIPDPVVSDEPTAPTPEPAKSAFPTDDAAFWDELEQTLLKALELIEEAKKRPPGLD